MSREPKRAYRYEVVDSGGEGTTAIGESPFILDWTYFGKEYTWNIVRGPRVESVGFIAGRFVDKGYVDGDGYKSDAELAADRTPK